MQSNRYRFSKWLGAALVAWVIAVLSVTTARAGIVFDNESDIAIRYEGPAAKYLVLPGELLARYLKMVRGRGGLSGPGDRITFVLNARALSWQNLQSNELKSISDIDAFTIIIPQSPADPIRIDGATLLSVSYGVTYLLEEYFGVTWLFPGELGLSLSDRKQFELPAGTVTRKPAVTSRLYTGMLYSDPDRRLQFRQKYRNTQLFDDRIYFEAYDYFKSLRLHNIASPSHAMIAIFPVNEFLEQHPQIRPMLPDGTRYMPPRKKSLDDHRHQNWHPCYTEPMVVQIAVQKARQAFENGALLFSLGINDGIRKQCQCTRCQQVGWPSSYYQFVTNVANAVKNQYPPRLIGVLVYGDVRHPPDDMKLPDNVLAMVTGSSPLEKWSKHVDHIGRYGYFFGSGFVVPSFPLKSMKWNAKIFKRYGVRSFRAEAAPVWAFDAPKIYIQSRLLWDPGLDVDAALARYCDAAYGKGGPAMKRFWEHWASLADYLVDESAAEPAPLCDMGKWRSAAAQLNSVTREDYNTTGKYLSEAESLADAGSDDVERLRMVRTWYDLSHAYFNATQSVQVLFQPEKSKGVQASTMASAQVMQSRITQLNKTLGEHKQWHLAAKVVDVSGSYSIENELRSGLVSGVMSMREQGDISADVIDQLPESLRPLATEKISVSSKPLRIRKMDHGIYYALERTSNRHAPMQSKSEPDRFIVESDSANPRRPSDDDANEEALPPFKRQWAFALVPVKAEGKRRIYQIDMTATGLKGELTLYMTNPWAGDSKDEGFPLRVSLQFDGNESTQTRRIYTEPVGPGSRYFNRTSSFRFVLLWDPASEDSRCSINTDFKLHLAEVQKKEKEFPTDPFALP